jgi:hypothetical protein
MNGMERWKMSLRKVFWVHSTQSVSFTHFKDTDERAMAQNKRIGAEIASSRHLSHAYIVTILSCYQKEEEETNMTRNIRLD